MNGEQENAKTENVTKFAILNWKWNEICWSVHSIV